MKVGYCLGPWQVRCRTRAGTGHGGGHCDIMMEAAGRAGPPARAPGPGGGDSDSDRVTEPPRPGLPARARTRGIMTQPRLAGPGPAGGRAAAARCPAVTRRPGGDSSQ